MPNVIDSFTGKYHILSNFSTDGGCYPTVEHPYQAMKADNVANAVWVMRARTPGEAKRRGRKVIMRPDWDDIKLFVMEGLLRDKFNPKFERGGYALALLLATGDAELVEGNHWGDTFWGVCNGVGENHLGKLLMKIRDEHSG